MRAVLKALIHQLGTGADVRAHALWTVQYRPRRGGVAPDGHRGPRARGSLAGEVIRTWGVPRRRRIGDAPTAASAAEPTASDKHPDRWSPERQPRDRGPKRPT